jgi:NAD(P)-dependent dehydrogenase (short-subunit alcohol dehydrogenase family)
MDLGLKDKVALVTGAGSQLGFGKAIAVTLAREGCNVIAADMYLPGAEITAAEIRISGRRAMAVRVDITDNASVGGMVEAVLREFGKIDILVNNAGISGTGGPFAVSREESWDQLIDVNIKGVLNVTRHILPGMLTNKYGKIVNIASGLGKSGGPGTSVYAATKGAVISFTKSLAAEVAASGVNVNCVSPGLAPSTNFGGAPERTEDRREQGLSERSKSVLATIPLGRFTEPRDVANMVAYLVSDLADDVVGQPFSVEGGRFMM